MGEGAGEPVFVVVDTDALRAAGSATLADADRVEAAGQHVVLAAAGAYGSGSLAAAARAFAGRYPFALAHLAGQVEDAGRGLRGSAQAYEYMDLSASDALTALDRSW